MREVLAAPAVGEVQSPAPVPTVVIAPVKPLVEAAPEKRVAPVAAEIPKPPAPAQPSKGKIETELGLPVPSILLEGDEPISVRPETSKKFFAGGATDASAVTAEEPELPQAYGTGRLGLTARDPHCLYAHWDLTDEQQRHYLLRAAHGHLLVRVYLGSISGRQTAEVHVHPESRHWFVHVERAGQAYTAELGYYRPDGPWQTISLSDPATTPHETVAPEGPVQFATMRFEPAAPGEPEAAPAEAPTWREHPALSPQPPPDRWQPLRPSAEVPFEMEPRELPPVPTEPGVFRVNGEEPRLTPAAFEEPWTSEQEAALGELLIWEFARRESAGSAEIAELVRHQVQRPGAVSSAEAAQFGQLGAEVGVSSPAEWGEVSSPAGGELPQKKGFWFNVNAELVIYGATEPDARVSIGGRTIRLRPDGTFSYRFSLPDGQYALPATAVAVHGETRHAELRFQRATRYEGEVGAHPQDPTLKPPAAENLA